MTLPSWIDNPLSIAAQRLAGAVASVNPIKADLGTVTKVIQGVQQIKDGTLSIPQSVISAIGDAANIPNGVNQLLTENGYLSASASQFDINFTPAPNPLSDLVNYTYHIRFFMTPEDEAFNNINPDNPNSNNLTKMIIAESGVTAGFNIIEFKLNNMGGPNKKLRNAWTIQDMEMTITEPHGLSLLDKMLAGAKQLRVVNNMRAPYFIELWFNGYDENGNLARENMYYNMFRVYITDIGFETNAAGTTYRISLLPTGATGLANRASTPPVNLTIKAVTLGEFFRKLETAWNKASAAINNDGIARITYKLVYYKGFEDWTLKNIAVAKQNARNTDMKAVIDGNETVITIARGQSIENIVNYSVYLCEKAQDWITGEGAPQGEPNLKDQAMLRYVTITAKDKITGWDRVTQDYTHEITYYMFPTSSTKAFTDMSTMRKIMGKATQVQKLQFLAQSGRLKKKYEYIYTGKNTEVLQFDIKLDSAWAVYQQAYNQVNNYNQITIGGVVDQNSVGYQATRGTLANTQTPATARLEQLNRLEQAAGQTGATIEGIDELRSFYANQPTAGQARNIANAAAGRGVVTPTQQLSPGAAALDAALSKGTPATTAQNPIVPLPQRAAQLQSQYIEDAANTAMREQTPLQIVGNFDPVPTQQNAGQNADQNKIAPPQDPSTDRPGTGFVGAIFGNIFSIKAFQDIEITIRGDPWWIPMSNIRQEQVANQLTGNAEAPALVNQINAEFQAGDNLFLLQLRPGITIDESTGLAATDNTQQEYWSGLYAVTEVSNMFSRGKFTQTLKGYKDVLAQSAQQSVSDSSASGHYKRDNA